ncbi:hypothetical protein [uncultured Bacteroides sp.]|uniref:hypothetical protein n=1 Tax=uncultured Bacteroides sp. TaxID=162156 RepID=UPI002618C8D5|nr:hypothetical protein [uncultured Bacteroides sp.]
MYSEEKKECISEEGKSASQRKETVHLRGKKECILKKERVYPEEKRVYSGGNSSVRIPTIYYKLTTVNDTIIVNDT